MKNYKIKVFIKSSIMFRLFFVFLFLLTNIFICIAQPLKSELIKSNSNVPDYNNLYYWAAHPWKYDKSDNTPKEIKNVIKNDSLADVFFIHPTTYYDKNFVSWNALIDNQELNDKTDNSTILYQASVFNESSRVFAPRYRQAHIKSFYIESSIAQPYFDTAYEDIKNAFLFYMEHYNNGRPIIIASHSQGTKHAGRLLKEFFDGKPLMKKLICAYIIGMPIPVNYFNTIPPCSNENQTGCFVGWRTYRKGYTPEFVIKENFISVVVNPLTWNINDSIAPANLNKGGVLKNFNDIVPGVVDAQIHHNILWSCKPNVFGKIFFHKKNFHIADINLFYMNIRENINNRIHNYLELQKSIIN